MATEVNIKEPKSKNLLKIKQSKYINIFEGQAITWDEDNLKGHKILTRL